MTAPTRTNKADEDVFDPKAAIYTPLQVATYGLNSVKDNAQSVSKSAGIGVPIEDICDYFPPVMPGQVCAIIGQTSNYKSGFMHFIEHKHAEALAEKGIDNTILIHVSVEEIIEEQAYMELSRYSGEDAGDLSRGVVQDWNSLERAAVHVGSVPIYRIGESLARPEDMPQLYISNMVRAIDALVNGDILDFKPVVAGMFFDYLQAFPIDPMFRLAVRDQQRRLQVRSDVYRLRQLSAKYRCPVYFNVQAKQHLDGDTPPLHLPGKYDGEESSSIAQRVDRIMTIWMPKSDNPPGTMIVPPYGRSFIVQENHLMIKVAKQRGRLPAGRTWLCEIDYATNEIRLAKNEQR